MVKIKKPVFNLEVSIKSGVYQAEFIWRGRGGLDGRKTSCGSMNATFCLLIKLIV